MIHNRIICQGGQKVKKFLIVLLVLAVLGGTAFYFREPILDLLPIDRSGWVEQDGNRYYLNEKGDPLTGWQQLEGSRRYFSAEGVLQTGWLEENGARYYLDKSGSPVSGWQTIQGKQHRFDEDGKLMHGLWRRRASGSIWMRTAAPTSASSPTGKPPISCWTADGSSPAG
jgi:hypothetical protein